MAGHVVDTLRHDSLFSANGFSQSGLEIDLVGAGATGSPVGLGLAKLGVEDANVWDMDKIEPHNIANQAYIMSQIGDYKATALCEVIKENTGHDWKPYKEEVDGSQEMGDIVFLLTDTMKSRKEIFDKAIKNNVKTKLLIETRMGPDNGRIYTINPQSPREVEAYSNTLYSDEEAEVSACGTSITVGATANVIANMAIWQFMRWYGQFSDHEKYKEEVLENEIIIGLKGSMVLISKTF